MDKLKTPPLTRASLFVYYEPNLKITDNRSAFYDKVKHQFSQIFNPEIKTLKYDMGDIDYYDPIRKKVIGINVSCFKFQDFNYEKIDTFLATLNENLSKFVTTYDIKSFTSFNFIYENIILINKAIGLNFSDYFTLEFDIKGKKQKDFLALEGTFVYKLKDGLLSVVISPVLNPNNETEKFRYNISFIANQSKMDLDNLMNSLKESHSFIEDIFENSLTKKYFDTLK